MNIDPHSANCAILPLYSMSKGAKMVAEKSGLNQWNGGGRARKPAESYIPVPIKIHQLRPGLLPKRDEPFELTLPTGQVVSAKLCQQGSKALMSSPNDHLSFWLFQRIDQSIAEMVKRFSENRPYTYNDLRNLNFDCLSISRTEHGFKLMPEPLDAYEIWVNENTA